MSKLYVVTKDGWMDRYGSQIYLIGVFDNLADAQKAGGKITEIEPNKEFPLKKNSWGDCEQNEYYLGGYYE